MERRKGERTLGTMEVRDVRVLSGVPAGDVDEVEVESRPENAFWVVVVVVQGWHFRGSA